MRNMLFSLRTRIILIVAFGFSIYFLSTMYQADRERDVRLQIAEHNLDDTARVIASEAAHIINLTNAHFVHFVSQWDSLRRFDERECQRYFAQSIAKLPEIANVLFALPDGWVICSAVPLKQTLNIADRPYFKSALSSADVVIGEAFDGRVTGERVLPIYTPISDERGEVKGILNVGLKLTWLNGVLAESEFHEGARVGLVDPQGRVLARYPDPEHWVGKNVNETSFFKSVVAHGGKGIAKDIGFDNVPRIFGLAHFYPTRTGPITLWVGYSESTVTAEADTHFRQVLVGMCVLLVITLTIIWFGVERLVLRPISVLADIMRRLGAGELSARSGIASGFDELSLLARSVDNMAETLESKNRKIALASRALGVLSAWNEVLLKPGNEQVLTAGMCKAVVDVGGYQMAWVGLAQNDPDKTVRPVAFAGDSAEYYKTLRVTWADTEQGQGPAGRAIREGAPIIVHEHRNHPVSETWREHIKRFGYRSIIALPLKSHGESFGVLVIGAKEDNAFTGDEEILLGEVASDLTSAIVMHRAQVERDRLNASLQTIEERFAAAAEGSPDAHFIFDAVHDSAGKIVDFKISALNSRAAQQIGLARQDAMGKTYLGLLPLYGTSSLFDECVQVASTGRSFEGEFSCDVPQKGVRWFRQQVVQVGDGIAISLRDITEWRNAGDALRKSERRLRMAIGAAHMGVWSWDVKKDQHFASEELLALFGRPSGGRSLSSEEVLNVLYPEDRDLLARAFAQADSDSAPNDLEYRVVWPDGSIHWLSAYLTAICDATGKPVLVTGVSMDITERKEAEISRDRANRALRTLSASNGELVRATSESSLLLAVCRVIVGKGGYRMVSVGYPKDDPEQSIVLMAEAQADQGYISNNVAQSWAGTSEGQLPMARAIRTRRQALDRNVADHLAFATGKALAVGPRHISNLALPLLDGARIIGALSISSEEQEAFDAAEIEFLEELATDLAYGIVTLRIRAERDKITREHEQQGEILQRSLIDSIQAIANTVEKRDPYTYGHQNRVAEIAVAIAKTMGLNDEVKQGIHLAGIVHDLGKISVPAEILSKPGKLSAVEYQLIRVHPEAGYDILKDIKFPWPIADIVLQHHERLDGTGYPHGLKGGQILLESRIMAVADVVEAMGSHRPYRASLGIEFALKEIERGRGTAYDPVVVDACLKLFLEEGFALPT